MSLPRAVIVDAVRTPAGRGKPGGALSSLHPTELLGHVLTALVERTGLDPDLIEDVIAGCVTQGGEQSVNIARNAVLGAGFGEHIPGVTVDRQCGSSQQAATFAAQGVMAGAYEIVIAGGVESMSRQPLGSAVAGRDPYGPGMAARYRDGLIHQGISAELIAQRWGFSRAELDAYAATSHQRAAAALASGAFDGEIVPVPVTVEDGTPQLVERDETVRPQTTAEGLAGLPSSFRTAAWAERFPELSWSITAGNSSPLTDGASAVLIMSEDRARSLGLRPRARFHGFAVTGSDPLLMLTGVIPATEKVLKRSGLTLDEMDVVEVNEAFAPVPLAWLADLGGDPARLNPWGGAIALGHALGSSGTRLQTTLLSQLEASGGRYGLQTMCEGGGMANALIVERLDP